MRVGGPGEPTTLFNGIATFDRWQAGHLVDLLPPFLVVRRDQAERLGFRVYMEQLAREVDDPSPGAQLVADWLAGILLVHALRAYAATEEGRRSGWLGALSHPPIASALQAIHERLDHPWTVGELAEVAAMSRSSFAEAFRARVGSSPLEYLTTWRMQVAAGILRDENQKLSQIASRVGYESDTAFSKAFKRKTGMTPSEYRARVRDRVEGEENHGHR